jgi:hypothetical protein
MATIDIGKKTSTRSFKIGGSSSSAKGGISITEFNNKLREAAKKGEKLDFKLLEQVPDTQRKRLDASALKIYVEKHNSDKAHVQEIFSGASPLSAMYTDTEGFSPKDSWLSGIVGKLLAFLAKPSLETLKGIAKGLVSEDGSRINLSDNKLLEQLDSNQKLAPLSAALRIVGTTDAGAQMKEELNTNPEAGKSYGKEAVDAYISQSLNRLRHVFDEEGNILNSKGDVLYGPLNIEQADIDALKAEDVNSLTVREGQLKWNDFVRQAYKYVALGQAGTAVDYVNTVFAIFNKKMRAEVESKSNTPAQKEHFRALNRDVINVFSEQLAREFGGEGIAKAFEIAFTRGAFTSDTARNAIVGEAATTATNNALNQAARDFRDTARSKKNALVSQGIAIAELVDNHGQYTVLDLGKVCNGTSQGILTGQLPNYDGNKLTLATFADAYKKSAQVLGQKASNLMSQTVLDTNLGDTKKRDAYLANAQSGTVGASKGIQDDAGAIATVAKDNTKTMADALTEFKKSIDTITSGNFLVNTNGNVQASDKFADTLSNYLYGISNIKIDQRDKNLVAADKAFKDLIANQALTGNFDISLIVTELIKVDPTRQATIEARIKAELGDESKVKSLIGKFVNHEEMISLANVVKAETIQDLVKSNTAISEYLLRQAENRALSVGSIDDIISDPQKLADASPELALIFADPEAYKSDSARAEMAMLGLMSILKSNPTLLSAGSPSAKSIAKKLFAKQVNNDDTKASQIANKLLGLVNSGKINPTGLTSPQNMQEAARLAGTSVSRARYLEFIAPQVVYAREAIVADRMSRMINAHIPEGSKANIYSTVEALADHLQAAAEKLVGADFGDVQTTVTSGLSGLSLDIVRNMFFPGDPSDTTGTNNDKLSGNSAIQSVMDAALRLKMILPRLYQPNASSSEPVVKKTEVVRSPAESAAQESSLQTAA